MHFDDLLVDHVGEIGTFQWMMIVIFGSALSIPLSWYTMGVVFLAAVPDHWCAVQAIDTFNLTETVTKNLTIPINGYDSEGNPEYAQCSRYVRNYTDWSGDLTEAPGGNTTEYCTDGWDYSTDTYKKTVATEFNLVCDKDFMLAMSSSLFMAGFLFGVISIGVVSDYLGRKPTWAVTTLCLQISAVTLSFVQSFPAYCVLRFLQGYFGLGAYTTGFILLMELAGPKSRIIAAMVPMYAWTIGYLLFIIPAYFLRDWRTLNLVTSGISCLSILAVFFIPESPRWLYAMNRTDKADVIMARIARVNKGTLPDPLIVTIKEDKKGNFLDLLRTPRMRLRSLVLAFIWMVCSLVYYGLSLSTNSLGGNNYVAFAISAAVEFPGNIVAHLTLNYASRRWTTALSMICGGLCLLTTIAIPSDMESLNITFSMLGKFFLVVAFAYVYNLSAESFPTMIRQQGLSTGSMCSRVGGIMAPYVGYLSKYGRWLPPLVFGVCSLTGGFLSLLLPETRGLPMPETLEEGENLGLKRYVTVPGEKGIWTIHKDGRYTINTKI